MKYVFTLTELEIQSAMREHIRSCVPHFAQPSDLYVASEYGKLTEVTVEYEWPKEVDG